MEIILSFGKVHLYVIARGGRLESLKKHPHKMDSSKSIPYAMTPQLPTVCMSLPSDFGLKKQCLNSWESVLFPGTI